MATAEARFTYIWFIENFSELTYIDLKSPAFVVQSLGDTVWYLQIDEYAGFHCAIRTNDFSEKKSEGINFEFSFLGADGTPLISKRSSEPRLFLNLMNREDFLSRWAEFLPNNTLTVRCRMWKKGCKTPTIDICYGRTKLKTHTGSFIWAIEEFSALQCSAAEEFSNLKSNEKKVFPFKPLTKKGPFMALILYLNEDSVYIKFLIEKSRDYAYSCELSLLDANGKVIVSGIQRGRTDYSWTYLTFRRLISKTELLAIKNSLLPNDTLHLRCSFEVCTGVASNENEYFSPNVTSVAEREVEFLNFYVAAMEADDSLEFEEYFVREEDVIVEESVFLETCVL